MVTAGNILCAALNARIIGSGEEAIILAHGFGSDQSVWDKVLPYLARFYRVLVFDWCFSGAVKDTNLYDAAKYSSYDAYADDLIVLMDEMNLKSSIFVGHSMSAMIGCIASLRRPELFSRLIFIAASPRYMNSEDYEGGFIKSDVEQIFSNMESSYDLWASSFASLAVAGNDPHSIGKFEKCLKRMRPEVALSVAKMAFLGDYRDTLERVVTPCTIIQTTKDMAVPNSIANYMKIKIKGNSTVEFIDTDGHYPQLTAHVQLLEVLGMVLGIKFVFFSK